MNKTIYKKDSKGNIRYITYTTKEDLLIQESGIVGTDNPVVNKSKCHPKNVGRSNATTGPEQALKQLDSKVTRKLKGEYFLSESEAKSNIVLLPMLAKEYSKESRKIEWGDNVYIQPKLDGMRCLTIIKDGVPKLISREGTEIITVPHIVEALKGQEDGILDGELYAHGQGFQDNMKLIKKYREGETEAISYHVYDMLDEDAAFEDRLRELHQRFIFDSDAVKTVDTIMISDEKYLKFYHKHFLEEGYEGSIIRHSEEGYKRAGRSSSLLKYKDFQDIALPIIDIIPSDARPTQGMVVCMLDDGQTFNATPKMPHKMRELLLINKANYVGRTAEVRFFGYTDKGIPRFPVCKGIRLDK